MAESSDYEEMLRRILIRLVTADKAAVSGVGGAIDAGVQAVTGDKAPWWVNEAADAVQGGVGRLNKVDIPKTVEAAVGMVTDTSKERAARKYGGQIPSMNYENLAKGPSGYVSYDEIAKPFISKENVKEAEQAVAEDEEDSTDDLLNQLLMAALMAGGKSGKQASLGGAAGGGISFGDPWKMRRDWERDYRYLQS